MILALFAALSIYAAADGYADQEREREAGEVSQETCAGGCFKDVDTTRLTNNRAQERQAIVNITSEGKEPAVSFSNTEGAAIREK